MSRSLFAMCVLSAALSSLGTAQGTQPQPGKDNSYSQAELKRLVRDAHTPEQFRELAGYYGKEQQTYLQKAAEEKQEWVRRSQYVMASAAKYPRPVDSAHNLYEYDLSMASQAEKLSLKYSQLAAR